MREKNRHSTESRERIMEINWGRAEHVRVNRGENAKTNGEIRERRTEETLSKRWMGKEEKGSDDKRKSIKIR